MESGGFSNNWESVVNTVAVSGDLTEIGSGGIRKQGKEVHDEGARMQICFKLCLMRTES